MIQVFVDGASRGNPGKAGIGVYMTRDGKPFIKANGFLGKATNNVAEYAALAYALFLLKEMAITERIAVHADSLLLIKQVVGAYKVKNATLKKWHSLIQSLRYGLSCSFTHVLRDKNSRADQLANEGIDNKVSLPERFIEQIPSS